MMRAFLEEPVPTPKDARKKKPRAFVKRETKPEQLPFDLPEMPRMDLPFRETPLADDVPPVTAEELARIEDALTRDPGEAPKGFYNRDAERESPVSWMGAEDE